MNWMEQHGTDGRGARRARGMPGLVVPGGGGAGAASRRRRGGCGGWACPVQRGAGGPGRSRASRTGGAKGGGSGSRSAFPPGPGVLVPFLKVMRARGWGVSPAPSRPAPEAIPHAGRRRADKARSRDAWSSPLCAPRGRDGVPLAKDGVPCSLPQGTTAPPAPLPAPSRGSERPRLGGELAPVLLTSRGVPLGEGEGSREKWGGAERGEAGEV